MAFIRSTIFNIVFAIFNFVACFVCLPFLLLPRGGYLKFVRIYTGIIGAMERFILGIKYEVRGLENLPSSGPYLVAAKHQSQYETFKLHALFQDPAIVLKRELVRIPLWGQFLAKINPIAIDRKSKRAIGQIIEGAMRVKEEGRVLVIFPQGTRVFPQATTDEKPYKSGIAMIAKETGMDVIPLAINSGLFWPRSGWVKRSGTVVFEFLPALPRGLEKEQFMQLLEEQIETASSSLALEAQR